MAITTKIFGNCSGSDFISEMKTTLEHSGLFDSVTYSDNNSGVYCVKDNVRLVTIIPKNSESDLALEFKNTSGSTIMSLDWTFENRSDTHKRYGSVSAVGDSVYIMFSGVPYGSTYDEVIFISVYVGKTDDGNIAMYYSRRLANVRTTSQEWEYRAFCSESYDSGGANTIGAPISTSERFINTYRIIGGLSEGMSLFENAYGIRYSPPLHTNGSTAVGITPVKVSIDNNDFLTDGIILIKDAE